MAAAAAAALLGEDGRGYELARRLDGSGAWRAWLGDSAYAAMSPALASPAAWDAFMTSRSTVHLHLQLRARALLFDKASASLFVSSSPASALTLTNLNPSHLQLHGDDVYFSLEDDSKDACQQQTQTRPAFGVGSRHDELSETWYGQYMETYRMMKLHKSAYGDKESHKRTPEGMAAYLRMCEIHKRRRQVFKDDKLIGVGDTVLENGSCIRSGVVTNMSNLSDEGNLFFPEIMFPNNCVPDSALPPADGLKENPKVEVYGVLDNLPDVISRSAAMMERFGIRPEHLKIESKFRGKDGIGGNKKPLGQDQACQMTQKVAARFLSSVGFEGGTDVSMGVLSEFIGNHICTLGRKLKILSDSYRKQYSSIELLKMFLRTAGYSNLGPLAEITKDTNRSFIQQTQQQVQQVRTLQSQHQNPLMQAQQFQRPMHPQMNMLHPQNLTIQQQQQLQQWEKLRRQRQATTPRGSLVTMDKDPSYPTLVDVKLENMIESPMDSSLNNLNKQQMQFRQQQIAMSNHHPQAGQQFKQLPSVQISQLQAQNAYNSMRTPPVKVEAFHDLVGGDSTIKHETEQSKLMSPQQK